jgi:hypothetical protein
MTSTSTTAASHRGTDESYATLERLIASRLAEHKGPLFTTGADPKELWGTFLHSLPEESRQHYNCRNCAFFVERFGGLVKISEQNGNVTPLLWSPTGVPEFFANAVWRLWEIVCSAPITGVFLSSDAVLGVPSNVDGRKDREPRVWTHLHGANPSVFSARGETAEQAMARMKEEHGMLARALDDYGATLADEVLRVLRSDSLSRSEKAVSIAEWFANVHGKVGTRPRSPSQVWLAVATAPPGFAHVRSTIISTLLDDVKTGLPFATIKRRWDEKLDPLAYQRPQAAPSTGQIDAAEKLVEKLGVARALDRRFARLADIPTAACVWSPRRPETPAPTGGTFGHLRGAPKDAVKRVALPPQRTSWEKFRREVLPNARRLEVQLPYRGNYFALTAPLHADAPAIFQWDGDVGWYFHDKGAFRSHFNLGSQEWGEVAIVVPSPAHWRGEELRAHHKKMALFVVAGARDLDWKTSGLALFPEFLASEFHGIRAVVEAHSKAKVLAGADEADACGLAFQDQGPEVTVRVDGLDIFRLDRWS